MLPLQTMWRQLPPWLLQLGIVLLVCGYSVALGMFAAKERLTLAMALVAAPAALLICALIAAHFQSFVLLLPLTALAVPLDLPSGTGSHLPISLLLAIALCGIWLASMFVRGWKLAPSPLNRPLLVFGAVCVVSLLWGRLWRDPGLVDWNNRFIIVQVASLVTNLVSIGACLLIGNFVTSERQLKYIVALFMGCGTLMVLVQSFRIQQSFLNIRGLWSLWLIAPAFSLLVVQPSLGLPQRLLLIALLIFTFQQVMLRDSLWLSGWVPGIIVLFVIAFLRSWKLFLCVLIVGLICGYNYLEFFQRVAEDNVAEGGLERIELWEQNLRIVRDHWFLGTGPAGYASYYATYFRETSRSTHNNYFDILAQFGVVGAVAWLWVAGASVWEGWRLSRRAPPGFLRMLAITATGGWIAAMASMMLGDWILPFAYNQTITGYKYTVFSWIFLGTLISIRQLLDLPAEASDEMGEEPG